MAAYEVETEIKNKIALGEFKDRQSLIEYRKTRLEDKARTYAESVGIDHADQSFQRGFNADILAREAAIYDTHAQKLSEQTQAIAQMEATSDLGSMFSDEGFLRSPDAAAQFAHYISASLVSGAIPTEEMAVNSLTRALADNSAQPGADVFMDSVGDQEVVLYGRPMKIRDIVGAEVLENYRVKAGEASYKRNRKLAQEFTFGIQDATLNPDPHAGLAQLATLQTALYKRQPTDAVTQQSQELDAARGRIMARIAQDSAQRQAEMAKQVQADNRLQMFEAKYQQRIAGENVSTDWKTFETDANTGDFKEEDAANYASLKLSNIDRMTVPQETKDKLKMQLLNADPVGGPFRKHFETLTADAMNQYKGLVVAQDAEITPETTARIREFQRMYQADPATIGALYPEQSELAFRIGLMERSGIDMSVMVDAERKAKGLTKEERIMQDQKWANLFNGSDSAIKYLPTNLRAAARALFDAEIFRTGDESAAKEAVNGWLKDSAVSFEAERNGSSATFGAITKRSLMVDPQNAMSWREGREYLHRTVDMIIKAKPWIGEGGLTVTETPQGIRITDPRMGSVNLTVTPEMLQKEWQIKRDAELRQAAQGRATKAEEAIDKYRNEIDRRKAGPFNDLR